MNRGSLSRPAESLILESTDMCINKLTELSHKLKTNREGLDISAIVKLKEDIANITKDVVTERDMTVQGSSIIDSELGQRKGGEWTAEQLKQNIRQKLDEAKDRFEANKDRDYMAVTSILLDVGETAGDMDEEMVLVEQGLTDASIKCPYSIMQFVEPMKNPGGANQPGCIHHVSHESLKNMCRSAAVANCPISGCRGKWSLKSAVRDEDFEKKIARFLKAKRVAELAESAAGLEEKEDYTQL